MPTIKDITPESVFTIALSTGIQGRRGVPGPIGPQGIEGPQGEPGKDYVLTKEDKEEITNVLDGIYKERIDIITPKNTSKGELVHITDGLPLPIYETKVDGNSKQDGEPTPTTPQPVEVVTGITNLFDGELELGNFNSTTGEKLTSTDYLINKNPIKVEELTKYKISLEGKGLRVYLFEYKEDMTYNLTTRKTINETSYISTEKGTKYINFRTIETNKNTNAKILLEKGTYINEYVPYGNNLVIENFGKNNFDGELVQGSFNGASNNARCFNKNNVFLEEGEYILINDLDVQKYKFGILLSENIFPTTNTNWILDTGWLQTNKYVFNVTKAGYFGINLAASNGTDAVSPSMFINNKFILVNTNLLTQISISLGNEFLGKIGNVKDELIIENNKVKLIKRIAKVVLDGTQFVQTYNGKTYKLHCFELEKKAKLSNSKEGLLSNKYKESIRDNLWNHNEEGFSYGSLNYYYKDLVFYSDATKNMTNLECMQWVKEQYDNGNPIIVYYILAEPYTIELGELENTIKTFEGVNNIQLLSNIPTEIEVKYAVDLKKYTDNKLAEISAQII